MNGGKPKEVLIPADRASLKALLRLPLQSLGTVAFAHGSGSGRFSPRNNFVAGLLRDAGIATLLADLLEESEASDRRKVFDIGLLTDRLLACSRWLRELPRNAGASDWIFRREHGRGRCPSGCGKRILCNRCDGLSRR